MRYFWLLLAVGVSIYGCRETRQKEVGPNTPEPRQEVPAEPQGEDTNPAIADGEALEAETVGLDTIYRSFGRAEMRQDGVTALIGSAASVRFQASGDTVDLELEVPGKDHAYALITVDDKLSWKYRLSGGKRTSISVPLTPAEQWNEIGVYKLTEAVNGAVLFHGASANGLRKSDYAPELNIEFIGNSITCGYGADQGQVPCGEGVSFDQHNPYEAFAVKAARAIGAGYSLSSVSGAGIYRNYSEADTLTIPERYADLYLNGSSTGTYPPEDWNPDIVSVCLGTNDVGAKRAGANEEFDQEAFVAGYIDFVSSLRNLYPGAAFVLVDSPMLNGDARNALQASLEQVRDHFSEDMVIGVLQFDGIGISGCEGHPGIGEHDQMARQLRSFLIRILDEIAEREEMTLS